LRQIDGVNMGERRRVPKHFYVECSDEVLFDLFRGELFLGEFGFEEGELLEDDAVFFLLGLCLTNAFDELFEFFGEM
jgi:hypothetical protein